MANIDGRQQRAGLLDRNLGPLALELLLFHTPTAVARFRKTTCRGSTRSRESRDAGVSRFRYDAGPLEATGSSRTHALPTRLSLPRGIDPTDHIGGRDIEGIADQEQGGHRRRLQVPLELTDVGA